MGKQELPRPAALLFATALEPPKENILACFPDQENNGLTGIRIKWKNLIKFLSWLNIELPRGTLVSWDFFFHEVEWLQTKTPPLCFMHSSIGIGFNPTVKRFPETTLIAANTTIRYGRLPQQGNEQGYEYIQGALIVTQQKPNSKATEHTQIEWGWLLTEMCFFFSKKRWRKSRGATTEFSAIYNSKTETPLICPSDTRELENSVLKYMCYKVQSIP